MTTSNESKGPMNATAVFGAILILLGIVLLAGRVFTIDLGHYLWPFFIMVPGVLLFVLALAMGGGGGEGLAIFGSIVTMVGLLLLFQNTTGLWATWAYAWALVAPTSIGLGQIVYGALKGQGTTVKSGFQVATVGLAIFVVGGIFFEAILSISGFALGNLGWAILLIGAGVLLLVRNLFVTGR